MSPRFSPQFLTLIIDEHSVCTPSQKRASVGAIVMIYISGFGWAMGRFKEPHAIPAEFRDIPASDPGYLQLDGDVLPFRQPIQ